VATNGPDVKKRHGFRDETPDSPCRSDAVIVASRELNRNATVLTASVSGHITGRTIAVSVTPFRQLLQWSFKDAVQHDFDLR
jgi:hypothetical protein